MGRPKVEEPRKNQIRTYVEEALFGSVNAYAGYMDLTVSQAARRLIKIGLQEERVRREREESFQE